MYKVKISKSKVKKNITCFFYQKKIKQFEQKSKQKMFTTGCVF